VAEAAPARLAGLAGLAALAVLAGLVGCHADVRPEGKDPEVVVLSGALGNRFVQAGVASDVVARLRIEAQPVRDLPRPAINLALVIDTSGSMEGRAIADARAASLALVDLLRDGDRLAVVTFDSRTEVLVPSTVLDGDARDEVKARLGRMVARGTTDMHGGLQAGLREVMGNLVRDGINRVVLLGDGVPNEPAGIEALAQAAGERGVTITALGLGLDYDETLMARVAQLSGGRFHYVEQSTAVASVFRDEVLRLQRTVARNAHVTLVPGPGVRIEGVVGQIASQSGTQVTIAVGDLAEGETRDLVVRLAAAGRRPGASVELLDAVMTFDDAVASAGRLERRVFLGAKATADEAELASGRNQDVERDAARVEAAFVTVQAIALARGGELDRARAMLDTARAVAEGRARESRDSYLAGQASAMQAVYGALPSVAPPSPGAAASAPMSDDERAEAAAVVRRTHDRAVRTIQGSMPH
jgi:Ca-activated chloride channel family protein